jgi:hypothetical protein
MTCEFLISMCVLVTALFFYCVPIIGDVKFFMVSLSVTLAILISTFIIFLTWPTKQITDTVIKQDGNLVFETFGSVGPLPSICKEGKAYKVTYYPPSYLFFVLNNRVPKFHSVDLLTKEDENVSNW